MCSARIQNHQTSRYSTFSFQHHYQHHYQFFNCENSMRGEAHERPSDHSNSHAWESSNFTDSTSLSTSCIIVYNRLHRRAVETPPEQRPRWPCVPSEPWAPTTRINATNFLSVDEVLSILRKLPLKLSKSRTPLIRTHGNHQTSTCSYFNSRKPKHISTITRIQTYFNQNP